MAHPVIDADECIACGVCVDSCPAGVLELQDVATVADEDSCVACGACRTLAPLARSPRSSRSNNSPPLAHSKVHRAQKGGLRIAAEASFLCG